MSHRYYLLANELDHNDFIAQGNVRRMLQCRAKPGDRHLDATCKAARTQYEAICEASLLFFDAHLKGERGGLDRLARQGASIQVTSRPYLAHVPRGVAGAEPFRLDSPIPPAPRQIRELMQRLGVDPTLELLKRYYENSPFAPVFHGDLGAAIVDDFLESGRIRDAIAVDRVYARFDPKNARGYFRMGVAYEKHGLKTAAIQQFNKALLLDPDDAEAAAHLKKLRAAK
jgi:hypothetical protein